MWLENAGLKAKEYGHRITSHPGPFNVLVSPNEDVVQNTITDLTIHGQIFDMMGLSRTPYNKLNIHCNGVYGDKQSALDRFCKNFERLPESVQTRLTVENDDKASMYSVKELYDGIYKRINIPIVFDYHHHRFCTGGHRIHEQSWYGQYILFWQLLKRGTLHTDTYPFRRKNLHWNPVNGFQYCVSSVIWWHLFHKDSAYTLSQCCFLS